MDDFALSINDCGPTQDIIVGGHEEICEVPDFSHFLGDNVIFEDVEEVTSSSDEGEPTDPVLSSTAFNGEDEFEPIKEEIVSTDESESDNSVSPSIDLNKKKKIAVVTSEKKKFIFITEDGTTAEKFDDAESTVEVTDVYSKPKMSYAQLIAEALMTDSDRMLTLNEIYIAINKQHPYYSLDAASGRNWQNAIRHNLTLNKAFIKVPRPATEGRGAFWKLETGSETQIFRRLARNYSRPKTSPVRTMKTIHHKTTFSQVFVGDDLGTVYVTVPN